MGVSSALVFANLGAAYGTAKAGVGIASMGIMHPTEVMKNIVPVIMAGILGIYGLIVAAILVGKSRCMSLQQRTLLPNTRANHLPIPPFLPSSSADARQEQLLELRGLLAPGGGPELRPLLARRRAGHRRRRRRGRARRRAAAAALRGHDPNPDLRRGARALRPNRGAHPQPKGQRSGVLVV